MAILHLSDTILLRVYANQAGSISIEQLGDRGTDAIVMVDPFDVPDLIKALESVAQEISNA